MFKVGGMAAISGPVFKARRFNFRCIYVCDTGSLVHFMIEHSVQARRVSGQVAA